MNEGKRRRKLAVREGTFLIGGGGGGASEGRVISKFFYKLGRVKPALFATGGRSV